MMEGRGVLKCFWAEVVATVVYLLNISPTKAAFNQTPYEAWRGNKPKVSHLRVFGCIAYALINSPARRKLDEKCEKCIFVGYSTQSKAYKLYNPVSGKITVNRNVVFNEDASWNFNSTNESSNIKLLPSDDIIDQEYVADPFLVGPSSTSSIAPTTSPIMEKPSAEPTPLRRSTIDRKQKT